MHPGKGKSYIVKKVAGRRPRYSRRNSCTSEEVERRKNKWLKVNKPRMLSDDGAKELLLKICEMMGVKVEKNAWSGDIRVTHELTEEQEGALLGDEDRS